MEAIVYCSQTGHTAQYARLLSQATGLPAYDFREAQSAVPKGAAILFLSWVMAGGAAKLRRGVQAVARRRRGGCGYDPAGAGPTGEFPPAS